MRKTRGFLLLALAAATAIVGVVFQQERARRAETAPRMPVELPSHVQASSEDWVYYKGDRDKPSFWVRARKMERVEEPTPRLLLQGLDLRLYHQEGVTFDRVQSAHAEFDENHGWLYAEGDVEIDLAQPAGGDAREKLLHIRTSGMRFDAVTGKAETDRPTFLEFDRGEGDAVGASYDPTARELHLTSAVRLTWRGAADRPPMVVKADELTYREAESKVYLKRASQFERDSLKIEGGDAVVTLEDGIIRHVEAKQGIGAETLPGRELGFGADVLKIEMSPRSEIERIIGEGAARLESRAATGNTRVTADMLFLDFNVVDGASLLRTVLSRGGSVFESEAKDQRGRRELRSEVIVAQMRPGGEDLEQVETQTPGVLELSGGPAQPKRRLEATRMWLRYAPGNRIESFRAAEVSTRTEPAATQKTGKSGMAAPILTESKDLFARFDPATGALATMEQWTNFRYQEGERKAKSERAILDQTANRITLREKARVWDPQGSVSADSIVLEQAHDRMTAVGGVESTRVGETKEAAPGMMGGNDPLHARADRMETTEGNSRIVYQGGATLWQGANRLQAERISIDRAQETLSAEQHVVNQLVEQPTAGKAGAAVLTHVTADALVYTDQDRLAHYAGSVVLKRAGIDVRAAELRAWLAEGAEGDSRFDRAFADGDVLIVQETPGRTRKGASDHAEYYTQEGKVILSGGQPAIEDSLKGSTSGRKLTYWTNNDSLLVEGAESEPASSRIRRK